MPRWGLVCAWILLTVGGHAGAGEPSCPPGLAGRIQADYQSIQGFEARFVQTDQRTTGATARARGTVAYLKPGRMRWEYQPPEEQLLVTDGRTVWLFDPLLENVTVQPLKGLAQGTPLAFLLGIGNLATDFACRTPTRPPPTDELRYLELVPKRKVPGLAFVQLGVTRKEARVTALRMVDSQGNVRTVRLEDLRHRSTFPKNHFIFQIKEGMEVIER